jgi:hypothetical protein
VNECSEARRIKGKVRTFDVERCRVHITLLDVLKTGPASAGKRLPGATRGVSQASRRDAGSGRAAPLEFEYKVSNPYENLTSSGLSCPPCRMRPDTCNDALTAVSTIQARGRNRLLADFLFAAKGDQQSLFATSLQRSFDDLLLRGK